MVVNVELSDFEAEALGGGKVTLSAPVAIENLPLGVSALEDVEAVVSAAGLTIAFQLEPDEVRAIQRGSNRFLLHFSVAPGQGLPPFRFIFEKQGFEIHNGKHPSEEDNSESGFRESPGSEET